MDEQQQQQRLFGGGKLVVSRAEQLFCEWREFHRANPAVYAELLRMALELWQAGRTRYGMHGLFEVLRWHRARLQTTDDEFKICDHHSPFYSRLIMMREKRLDGFFVVCNPERYAPFMATLARDEDELKRIKGLA